MKRFRKAETVEAAPIYSTDPLASSVVVCGPDGHPAETVTTPPGFFVPGRPEPGDYLVRYTPGCPLVWTPKGSFEKWYVEIPE